MLDILSRSDLKGYDPHHLATRNITRPALAVTPTMGLSSLRTGYTVAASVSQGQPL